MKVKNMPNGTILWNGYNILGIKGNTLEEKYGNKYDEFKKKSKEYLTYPEYCFKDFGEE